MIEAVGDIWDLSKGNSLAIPTNGLTNFRGQAIMGRGIAKEAKDRYPDIAIDLGVNLLIAGNRVFDLGQYEDWHIYSFPTKHNWRDKSSIDLIKESCIQIVRYSTGNERIFIGRPGCGNGGLLWEDVKPAIEPLLDDRFIIVNKE